MREESVPLDHNANAITGGSVPVVIVWVAWKEGVWLLGNIFHHSATGVNKEK